MKNSSYCFFKFNKFKRKNNVGVTNDNSKKQSQSFVKEKNTTTSDISSQKGLLDMLSYEVGCMYVSDLHNDQLLPLIRHVILKIDENNYNIQEWYELIYYITGQRVSFLHQNEAKDYLVNYCENYKKKSRYLTE